MYEDGGPIKHELSRYHDPSPFTSEPPPVLPCHLPLQRTHAFQPRPTPPFYVPPSKHSHFHSLSTKAHNYFSTTLQNTPTKDIYNTTDNQPISPCRIFHTSVLHPSATLSSLQTWTTATRRCALLLLCEGLYHWEPPTTISTTCPTSQRCHGYRRLFFAARRPFAA